MEERYYTRIKRGMVFWYNIDASVNKFDVPELKISEKRTAKDHMEYGDRPWLLVSVDERNLQGKTCTIVPLCTNSSVDVDKFHVPIRYKGKDALILCEHLRTVNCIELIKYDCTLEDSTMKLVENALRDYLGIRNDVLDGLVSDDIMSKLEDVINEIVRKKVEEEKAKISKVVNVDDAVLRISEGLESLFDVKSNVDLKKTSQKTDTSENVKVEEFLSSGLEHDTVQKSKSSKKSSNPSGDSRNYTRKKVTRTLWDRSLAISFMQECEVCGLEDVAKKYGYADANSVRKTMSYLRNRFSLK